MSEKLSEMVARIRTEKGLSQRQLAEQSGVDRGYINKIEHGVYSNITLDTARLLAKGLGIRPAVFLDGDSSIALQGTMPFNELATQASVIMPIGVPLYSDVKLIGGPKAPETFLYYRPDSLNGRRLSGYRVHEDWLPPWILSKDTIVIDEEIKPEPGNIVVFIYKNQVNFGKLMTDHTSDKVRIKSDDSYTDLEDCETVARVIEVIKRV